MFWPDHLKRAQDYLEEMWEKDDPYLPLPEGLDYKDIEQVLRLEQPYLQSDFI